MLQSTGSQRGGHSLATEHKKRTGPLFTSVHSGEAAEQGKPAPPGWAGHTRRAESVPESCRPPLPGAPEEGPGTLQEPEGKEQGGRLHVCPHTESIILTTKNFRVGVLRDDCFYPAP